MMFGDREATLREGAAKTEGEPATAVVTDVVVVVVLVVGAVTVDVVVPVTLDVTEHTMAATFSCRALGAELVWRCGKTNEELSGTLVWAVGAGVEPSDAFDSFDTMADGARVGTALSVLAVETFRDTVAVGALTAAVRLEDDG